MLRRLGNTPETARRQTELGSVLGRARWVERIFAWLHHFQAAALRSDRRAGIHEAFIALGCCLAASEG